MLAIKIDTRAVDAALARTRSTAIDRETLHKVAAASVSTLIRGWLLARNIRSSTSNYWSKAAESTTHVSDATSGRVLIRHPGIGWHRYGGTIVAKPGKALAIPLQAALKGIWPSERFPDRGDAFVYRAKSGKAFLATSEGGELQLLYILLKSVSKSADPSVLPDASAISASATSAIRDIISLRLSRP
jgi:hypothetical protein